MPRMAHDILFTRRRFVAHVSGIAGFFRAGRQDAVRQGIYGALAVEYAFCMLLIAVMMAGVQELFWEMAQEILDNFMNWVGQTYP